MSHSHIVLLNNSESREMVEQLCVKYGFAFDAFDDLIQAEINQVGKLRKHGLWHDFDDILDRIKTED